MPMTKATYTLDPATIATFKERARASGLNVSAWLRVLARRIRSGEVRL